MFGIPSPFSTPAKSSVTRGQLDFFLRNKFLCPASSYIWKIQQFLFKMTTEIVNETVRDIDAECWWLKSFSYKSAYPLKPIIIRLIILSDLVFIHSTFIFLN